MPRDALFDLAVNRALTYARRLDLLGRDPRALRMGLEPWYLKTRFAYRIPLEEVLACLSSYPGHVHHWQGGVRGGWVRGENPRP